MINNRTYDELGQQQQQQKNEMTGIIVVMSEVIYCTNLVFILPVTTVY